MSQVTSANSHVQENLSEHLLEHVTQIVSLPLPGTTTKWRPLSQKRLKLLIILQKLNDRSLNFVWVNAAMAQD